MKRIRLLLVYVLCVMVVPFASRAQGFAPLGAEWTYSTVQMLYGPVGKEFVDRYKVIEIDTFPEKVFKTITHNHYQQQVNLLYPYYWNRDTVDGSLQFYEKDDTVWVYNNVFQKYTPLYIFNVQEGDTLRIPILDIHPTYPNVTPEGDSVFVLIVDSIRTVNYGGVNAATYFVSNYIGDTSNIDWSNFHGLQDLPNPIFNWTNHVNFEQKNGMTNLLALPTGAYTRLFGGVSQGLLPERFDIPSPNNQISEIGFKLNEIKCFSNDTAQFKMYTWQGCDTFIYNRPLAINAVSALKGVDIYPNPARNILVLQAQQPFGNNTNLTIIDMLGRTVVDKTAITGQQQHTLSVASWNAGTYVLILEQDEQRYYRKVQVVH